MEGHFCRGFVIVPGTGAFSGNCDSRHPRCAHGKIGFETERQSFTGVEGGILAEVPVHAPVIDLQHSEEDKTQNYHRTESFEGGRTAFSVMMSFVFLHDFTPWQYLRQRYEAPIHR